MATNISKLPDASQQPSWRGGTVSQFYKNKYIFFLEPSEMGYYLELVLMILTSTEGNSIWFSFPSQN